MKKLLTTLAATGALCSGVAFAQPAIVGETVSVGPDSTGNTITVDYLGTGSGAEGGQFDFNIANTNVTVTDITCNAPFTAPGTAANMGTILFVNFPPAEVQDVAPACTFTFDVAAIAEAMLPETATLAITNDQYGGPGGSVIPGSGSTDGTINIVSGPSLAATNSPLALSIPTNGSTMGSLNFAASNGEVTMIDCTAAGDSEISFDTSGVPGSTSGSFDVPATCSSSAAGSFSSVLTCAYDGGSAAGTVTCDAADGAPVVAADPMNGGLLTIPGLLPGGIGSRDVTFFETGGAGSGQAYTVSNCSITGTDFRLSDTGASVPFGGSASITVTADGPRAVVTETLTCDITVGMAAPTPYSIDVTVTFRPLVVPTLQQWGMILMVLSLAAFGFVTLRRRGEI